MVNLMKVTFTMDGVADDRIFRDVLELQTGEYEHVNGTGTEAIIKQRYEGDIDEFPVRGYENITAEIQEQ